ncbi:suppressor of fused domain protein [Psychromicrobium xiongbiense]|uniref:suppressor of fused domain protein n=1 Tax=Psychromicrobium xiongbiense TaxID=3051184 RepID=UPI002554927C|nr:suppressor of fused domain protein [Psychromicrobium sp. YIM S02556]
MRIWRDESETVAIPVGGFQPTPGRVFPQVYPGSTACHALLWYPFIWNTPFEELTSSGRSIEWLMPIPITDAELAAVADGGPGTGGSGTVRLIPLLEAQRPDIWDLNRTSVI